MERKGLVRYTVLTLMWILHGCCPDMTEGAYSEVMIDFNDSGFISRAMDPEENRINDASILVYDCNGMLEEALWYREWHEDEEIKLRLLSGKEYRFITCVNFGYRICPESMDALSDLRFYIAYPDEYREGIPMTGDTGLILIEANSRISLGLTRLMAKVSLRIDRRKLSDNVEMKIRSVEIGNCPKSVMAFAPSKAEGPDECFSMGFFRNPEECSPLNQMAETGISKAVNVYLLENLQGKFGDAEIHEDSGKVFGKDDPRQQTCSYMELGIDYVSPDWKSSERGLIYRFYLGEDRNSLNVERNCHYRITLCPEDDGLKEDSWRVDKSNLTYNGPVSFRSWPESYIRGNIGDKVHLGCTFTPSFAPFDIGMEELMEDKQNGIYDFEVDKDGHGVTLTLTGPGRGLVYMEVGEPVNEAAMWIIEVNLPDS